MDDHLEQFRRSDGGLDVASGAYFRRSPSEASVHERERRSVNFQDAIASEIISRLFLVHRLPLDEEESSIDSFLTDLFVPSPNEIERDRFLSLILRGDTDCAHRLLDELMARGLSNRQLLCDLMSGAAEHLGELWEEDRADFAEVTMALCHLHRILRERSWSEDPTRETTGHRFSMVMTTFAGEQHIFGAMVASELFRQAGWHVTTMAGGRREEVLSYLEENEVDVLGISSAHVSDEKEARAEIAAFRAASKNLGLKVLVGGQAFLRERHLFKKVGADAMAEDADATQFWHSG